MPDRLQSPDAPRILFLGSQMATGGSQRVLLLLASWFRQRGYSVAVAFLYDKENLLRIWCEQYGLPICNLEFAPPTGSLAIQAGHFVRGLFRLFRLLRASSYTAILTFGHHATLIGLPLAWLTGVPNRVASHRGKIEGLSHVLERLHAMLINSAITKCLVVVSDRVRQDAMAEGVRAERIVEVPNGVLLPGIDGTAAVQGREQLHLNGGAPVLLSVGRLRYQKAHSVLLKALPGILVRFPDARVLIAGEGVLRQELEDQAASLNVSRNVQVLGIRHDIPVLMSLADLFVFPSRFEGMPNVVLEAMSHGLPVIATAVQGVDEVIRDRQNGILVPLEDPTALSYAVLRLLEDPAERQRLGRAARETIEKGYTVDRMCRQYEQLLLGDRVRDA